MAFCIARDKAREKPMPEFAPVIRAVLLVRSTGGISRFGKNRPTKIKMKEVTPSRRKRRYLREKREDMVLRDWLDTYLTKLSR